LTKKNKKGKLITRNVRPYIKKLELESINDKKAQLNMILSMGSIHNLSPQHLLNYMIHECKIFKEFPKAKIHRIDMLINGENIEMN